MEAGTRRKTQIYLGEQQYQVPLQSDKSWRKVRQEQHTVAPRLHHCPAQPDHFQQGQKTNNLEAEVGVFGREVPGYKEGSGGDKAADWWWLAKDQNRRVLDWCGGRAASIARLNNIILWKTKRTNAKNKRDRAKHECGAEARWLIVAAVYEWPK